MMSLHGLARCAGFGCFLGLLVASTSACSDPAKTPAQGAFEATFSGQHCAATESPGPNASVGTASTNAWAPIQDGTAGVHVACNVASNGDKWATSLKISAGSTALTLSAQLPANKSAATTTSISLSSKSTSGGIYVPNAGTTCTAKLIEADTGRAKGIFDCEQTWNSVGSPDAVCAFTGTFIVENCN
jgi:hypothetical protein